MLKPLIDDVQLRFKRDVAEHKLTIVRDEGLYRHLKCARPDDTTCWFDIVTWPGYLAYVGDMGDYVFARVPDMLSFFRGAGPNFSYWAEKVQAADKHNGVEAFSVDAFDTWITETFDDYWKTYGGSDEERAAVWDIVDIDVLSVVNDGSDASREAASRFEHEGRRPFADAWCADLNDYTYRYRWCCYALVWAVQQYDAMKSTKEA